MAIRYAEDKPKSCEYCYFWNEKKKECRQMRCFYQLPEKPPDPDPAHRFWVPCKGCPYGRNPCIGYCMAKILKEQRKKQSGYSRITTGRKQNSIRSIGFPRFSLLVRYLEN